MDGWFPLENHSDKFSEWLDLKPFVASQEFTELHLNYQGRVKLE